MNVVLCLLNESYKHLACSHVCSKPENWVIGPTPHTTVDGLDGFWTLLDLSVTLIAVAEQRVPPRVPGRESNRGPRNR